MNFNSKEIGLIRNGLFSIIRELKTDIEEGHTEDNDTTKEAKENLKEYEDIYNKVSKPTTLRLYQLLNEVEYKNINNGMLYKIIDNDLWTYVSRLERWNKSLLCRQEKMEIEFIKA